MLGHDGPPQGLWRENLITGADLARCPVREILDARDRDPALVEEFGRHVGTYYPAYRDGHLLIAGGVADQPARYLDMMAAIVDVVEASDAKHHELTAENGDKEN